MTPYAYIGTITSAKDGGSRKEGIFLFKRDAVSGKLTRINAFETPLNPTYLRMHPNKKYLYSVVETVDGGVAAFSVSPVDYSLTLINTRKVKGDYPCHVSFDPKGQFVFFSNYGTGSLAVYPIQGDGGLGPMSGWVEHLGSGPHPQQNCAHAHSTGFDPSGKFMLAADLGLDRIFVYKFDAHSGTLMLNELSGAAMNPGAGPRHFVFHSNGKILYVANELNATVTVCTWDAGKGILTPVQTLPTIPASHQSENAVADIHLDPTARWLYISNRGHNSLAMFVVQADGLLAVNGHVSCGGNWPRNFTVAPDGRYLYVANQRSGNVATFRIHEQTGIPELIDDGLEIPAPLCIELVDL